MPVRANERVAWFNGEFMPEREVRRLAARRL